MKILAQPWNVVWLAKSAIASGLCSSSPSFKEDLCDADGVSPSYIVLLLFYKQKFKKCWRNCWIRKKARLISNNKPTGVIMFHFFHFSRFSNFCKFQTRDFVRFVHFVSLNYWWNDHALETGQTFTSFLPIQNGSWKRIFFINID